MTPQQLEPVGATPPGFHSHLPALHSRLPLRGAASKNQISLQPHKPLRTIQISLAGCGVVGSGLVRLLNESASGIASRFGVRFAIGRVLVRDADRIRNLPLDPTLFTSDLNAFLAHDADVVVEAVGGEEPALTIARTALQRGQTLISANKELIALHGEELADLATLNHGALDFGAAVGGSVPVISTLRDLVGTTPPISVRGILNGTSNFVITQLERGVSLEAALSAARQRGLAEADCARDLDGSDAAAKLSIIAWIAFGIRPSALPIRQISLLPHLKDLVTIADALGARLRFLGECQRLEGGRVVASIEPTIVSAESAFARTTAEENRVEVDLGWNLPLSVSGPGAGGPPTAAAIVGDLVRFSAPANARGLGALPFTGVDDPRAHRWLFGASLSAAALKSFAARCGVPIAKEFVCGHTAAFICDAVDWKSIDALAERVRVDGIEPIIARCESGIGEERS